MAMKNQNLSKQNVDNLEPSGSFRFGVVVSEWNSQITNALLEGATRTLKNHGVKDNNIVVYHVPGSFELPQGAAILLKRKKVDAVICIGCVIQGETRHFEFICQAVSQGITSLSINTKKPVIFGVLTTDTLQQAIERSGGKHGNKGDEAAIAALKMAALAQRLKSEE